MKNTQSKIKPIKIKKSGTTHCLGCKDYTDNFKPQKRAQRKIKLCCLSI